ncbi:aromatic di-alanine and TPR containing protein [Ceratobasidium sp. AG-Ba]|nr:aromatic di-alanine and TPR containing protein [Ceratobasidium sp. AG-Ba]
MLTHDGHPDKSGRLSNLGISWLSRFRHFGELSDLDRALECQSQSVKLIDDSHPDKPACLSSLGSSWMCRFERLGKLEDLDIGLEHELRAVGLTPDGHPSKVVYLYNLGESLISRSGHSGQRVDLENACSAFKSGATNTSFKPSPQMRCAKHWATISAFLGMSPLEAYQVAFSLLPRLVWIGQTIKHRHSAMNLVSDLAAQAAAWATTARLYDLALEWLEQGRSVIWNQTLQLRTPFDDLSRLHPALAQELQEIASQLDSAGSEPTPLSLTKDNSTDLVSQASQHHRLAFRWDQLIAIARTIPGFHDFMSPPKAKELKKAAKDGPVVIINTYRQQCDALIIMPHHEDIIHVPLTNITQEKLEEISVQTSSLMGGRGSYQAARGFTRKNPDCIQSLTVLWSDVVEPVLKALSYTVRMIKLHY